MEKYKERLLSVLNIAVIFAVIIGIVIGLYFLGIFKLPEFVQTIIFGAQQDVSHNDDNSNLIYSNISDDDSSISTIETQITSENLKQILSSLESKENYFHEVNTDLISGSDKISQKISMRKQNGFYQIVIYNSDGISKKELQQFSDTIDITYYENGQTIVQKDIPRASFDISDEIGVVITHELFLESLSEIDNATYDFSFDAFGAVIRLDFDTQIDDYVLKQVYWLSLDYGVVVQAQSFENDVLIYQMTTNSLTDI